MSNETPDRQRTRQDLQDLAKQAKTWTASSAADSSGFVDLSALSSSDASWADRELARAGAGAPLAPGGKSNAINSLSPQSMAPVALSALLAPPAELAPAPRGRRFWVVAAGLAGIAGIGTLAVIMARSAPSATRTAESPVAVADPTPVEATPPAAAAQVAPETTAAAPAAPGAPTAVTAPAPAEPPQEPRKKDRVTPSRTPVAAAAAQPRTPAGVPPRSKSPSSGDSLIDMMRASVKAK